MAKPGAPYERGNAVAYNLSLNLGGPDFRLPSAWMQRLGLAGRAVDIKDQYEFAMLSPSIPGRKLINTYKVDEKGYVRVPKVIMDRWYPDRKDSETGKDKIELVVFEAAVAILPPHSVLRALQIGLPKKSDMKIEEAETKAFEKYTTVGQKRDIAKYIARGLKSKRFRFPESQA